VRAEDFDYHLPAERIAQTPIEPRDQARLLVDRGSAAAAHRRVCDLPDLLQPGDVLVVNTTKVIPARLHLQRRTGGAVEVLMIEAVDGARTRWEALVRPARKMQPGEVLVSADGREVVRVEGRSDAGDTMVVRLLGDTDPLVQLERLGEMPLPPYIHQRLQHAERYQTVYAEQPGSAAAPTAGLHFTDELLSTLRAAGVHIAEVELMVGLDTFRPISTDDPRQHRMHSERYHVPAETMEACAAARRTIAVGTTTVRALESAARGQPFGRTDIFIHRPYDWKVVDLLMTNFHMPRTTLLMMIDAFVGDRWRRLYGEALDAGYRFLSFGDAMLLDRRAG
jgi:S-adenosylmethionine:tRNA ribosyltransferase-isomerase